MVERRLDGSRWLHWRSRLLALAPCEGKPSQRLESPGESSVAPPRSAEEKARARQRQRQGRRQWGQGYERLRDRPIWQAIKNSSLPTGELL